MPTPAKIVIEISDAGCGAYTARPVNARHARKYAKHMREVAGDKQADGSVFFQSAEQLPALPRAARRDLDAGWDVRIKVDPWEFGHWLGYDASEVRL